MIRATSPLVYLRVESAGRERVTTAWGESGTRWLPWAVAGLVVSALFWIDPLFIPLALLGPIVTGAVAGWTARGLRYVTLLWLVAGLGAVVSDYLVNREDVVFHLVLTLVMMGLAAGAWAAVRAIRR